MSLFIPALDTVVTTFLFEQDGVPIAIMPSFRKVGGGINIFNLTSFNNAIATYFRTNLVPYTANDCLYQLTGSRRQHYLSDIAANNGVGAGSIGSLGGHAPNVLAMRFELRTSMVGRNFRGSLYWPSLALDLITGSNYS